MFWYIIKDLLWNNFEILEVLMLEWVVELLKYIIGNYIYWRINNAEKLRVSLLGLTMVSESVPNIKVKTENRWVYK